MTISPDIKLSPYEILAPKGSGRMGEVAKRPGTSIVRASRRYSPGTNCPHGYTAAPSEPTYGPSGS
jgi:hypothetical protein